MKWLKKWCYLILFAVAGLVYLTFVDDWQVYAGPLEQVKEWCRGLEAGKFLLADGAAESRDGTEKPAEDGENVSGGGSVGAPGEADGSGTEIPGDSGAQEGSVSAAPEADSGDLSGTEGPGGEAGGSSEVSGGEPGSGSGNVSGTEEPGEEAGGGPEVSVGEPGSGSVEVSVGEPEGGSVEVSGTEAQYTTVEDDYFADAVFIGDSRTVGMFEYGGLEETAAFYASTGLTVYKMFEAQIVQVPGERKKITVEEALQQNSFGKIYLMIGINEMGTGTVESFLEKYQEIVNHLKELQPDAVIYLQAIIKVTTERSAQGDYISNEGIIERNEGIAKLADNEKVFFLDVNPLICDETGGMIPEYTFDGVHLKAKYIGIWKDYLKSHAISS